MKAANKFTRYQNTLRFRLILVIGLIILFCQCVSVLWLWHESKEQIDFMVEAAIQNINQQKNIDHEIHEAIASLVIPSLVILALTLTLCYQAVKWIIRPLSTLQLQLENRSEDDLHPIEYKESVIEIDAVALAINQLIERLSTTLDRERMFTADVAHELRTPLAGLRLHLELMEQKYQVMVRPLIQRLDQMTNSVSQLLQLARVGQSFASGSYQHVDLQNDVVLPLSEEVDTMLAQRNQQLHIDIRDTASVRGDATLIKVALRNLIENAHRYSPQGSTITLTQKQDNGAVLMVEDEGPGIDENKRGELSKAFVRMDSRYGGIGLGLSIVTRIAQLHQARFFLENRKGVSGCCASLIFSPHENLKS